MTIEIIEENVIRECLFLLTHITGKYVSESDKTPVPEYYENAIKSLGFVISVCNQLLGEYKKSKK